MAELKGIDLKVQRIRARLTQEDVARAASRERRWVIRVEQMDVVPPSQAERYAHALLLCATAQDRGVA